MIASLVVSVISGFGFATINVLGFDAGFWAGLAWYVAGSWAGFATCICVALIGGIRRPSSRVAL